MSCRNLINKLLCCLWALSRDPTRLRVQNYGFLNQVPTVLHTSSLRTDGTGDLLSMSSAPKNHINIGIVLHILILSGILEGAVEPECEILACMQALGPLMMGLYDRDLHGISEKSTVAPA